MSLVPREMLPELYIWRLPRLWLEAASLHGLLALPDSPFTRSKGIC